MKIILAKRAGFCFGVKRATQMAFEAAGMDKKTYTLGPIIHSPQVVNRLEEMGVKVLKSLESMDSGTIIIRSHGVAAGEIDEAVQKQLEIVDATCPFVKKAQEHVKSLSESGYGVVVVGDADHPEVQGIVSYGGDKVFVVGSGEEVRQLPKMNKIGVVAQTTQSFENLKNVVSECLLRGGEIRVFNTICDATAVRQEEAKELACQVDCMLVVGWLQQRQHPPSGRGLCRDPAAHPPYRDRGRDRRGLVCRGGAGRGDRRGFDTQMDYRRGGGQDRGNQ